MMYKKQPIVTGSESVAIIEYCLSKHEENGNVIIARAKVERITFLETNYYHSAYCISAKTMDLIMKQVKHIESINYVFTKGQWKEELPF